MKPTRYRNKNYLEWVAGLKCCVCGSHGGDAHHIKGIGHLSGAGLKAPDTFTMPMCRGCHTLFHSGQIDKTEQWEGVARTLARSISEGVFAWAENVED